MLSVPFAGRSMIFCGRMWPYATTTDMSGLSAFNVSNSSGSRAFLGWNTGSSSSIAICLMGEWIISRERPCGLSGCVTTPTTSKPSPRSARSGGVANSGVPQKRTRTLQFLVPVMVLCDLLRRQHPDVPRVLLPFLFPLRHRRSLLEYAHVVEEHLSVQMI